MNNQRKLTRKEKIKLSNQDKTIKHPSASTVRRSVHASSPLPSNKWHKWFYLGVIVLITFITFSAALRNGFTGYWDDNIYVTDNKALTLPIMEGIKYFFGLHYFAANYTPITMIIYALEYHSVGLNPELYHLTNILMHLLNVMMVFWFIYLLSGKNIPVAAIVSLFFGIHPMHVESVAWISELKDVLYTFFFIGGLITYYKYLLKTQDTRHKTQDGSRRSDVRLHYFLTFILFVISTLSKPAAVTFPIVLLLLDLYTKRKFDKYVWIEKIPFFIVSFIFGIITIKAQEQGHAISESFTIFQRILFASYSILDYIVKLFLPINLSAVYPYPGHLAYFYYLTPLVVLLLFYGAYRTFQYSRLLLFGLLFFLINIALVLQVVSVGTAIMADRYTYLPYIGLLFVIAMGFSRIYNSKVRRKILRTTSVIVIILYSLFFIYCSYARCQIWKNGDTLWTDVLNKFPDNHIALNNKGAALYDKGEYKEAMKFFSEAIQIRPNYSDAYISLAVCYHLMHDNDNALKNIDIGLKYSPDNFKALNNKGAFLIEKGQYKEAMEVCTEAIRLKVDFSDAYINLAESFKGLHDDNNALNSLDLAIKYAPQNPLAYNNKAAILFEEGKYQEAMELFKETIRLNPQYADGYMNIGSCYSMLKDNANAIFYWEKSLEFNPNNVAAYRMLGAAYQNKGDNVSSNAYFAKAKLLEKNIK